MMTTGTVHYPERARGIGHYPGMARGIGHSPDMGAVHSAGNHALSYNIIY